MDSELFPRNVHIHDAHGRVYGAGSYRSESTPEGRFRHRSLIQGEIDPGSEPVRQMTQHAIGFGVLMGHTVLKTDEIPTRFYRPIDFPDQNIQFPFRKIERRTNPYEVVIRPDVIGHIVSSCNIHSITHAVFLYERPGHVKHLRPGKYGPLYAVEDRTPRVYPWMNEPDGGIMPPWNI